MNLVNTLKLRFALRQLKQVEKASSPELQDDLLRTVESRLRDVRHHVKHEIQNETPQPDKVRQGEEPKSLKLSGNMIVVDLEDEREER